MVVESGKRAVDEVVLVGKDVPFVALIVERLVVVDVAFTEGVVLVVTVAAEESVVDGDVDRSWVGWVIAIILEATSGT